MDVLRITGSQPLEGTITASGAKNACLPIFAATLLTGETCVIENAPDLSDVRFMGKLLEALGAEVERPAPNTWRITAKEIAHRAPYDLVRKMRASVCLLGPLVARMKQAEVSLPGGCVIGPRPIDLHLKGLSKLGCEVEVKNGYVFVDAKNAHGGHVFLGGRHGSTVTGTANLVMAAVMTPGITRIESAACEPEVVDLCKMLLSMGAKIDGVGSHALTIEGVERLGGTTFRVINDRIEAGSFLLAAAMTESNVRVEGAEAEHLAALLDKLEEAGLDYSIESADAIRVRGKPGSLKPVDIITLPHPGYPTDVQAQMCTLMSMTPGLSIITERIYPNRFMHVPELQRMGADIAIEGASAIIKGKSSPLSGAPVMASDLRASAALVLAGLAATGDTWVQRIYHLDRGYEKLDEKLRGLGAKVERLPDSEMPKDEDTAA
ncbi:UDP-N-acetylglucosamine 1-carboxyvinyltransferase [Rubellicoccus peritrichatus]|uniref:UDP-N-acetylglucosamine 1-carboxyvinyltransferase n=1 Tax=Rubellicoccus peritrichatus TaxID=3080537 RepID=A0AAQ3LF05_9BACT|nr:UDP-N-acetylglucosamine 1-carboxyvinyltransferase [Puniceicoccus sp. CR14]WOO42463.1 UDP-N-acetylglucosamine 1-carboxyvinyltransferase [Puniceicoccus sp. CR14]